MDAKYRKDHYKELLNKIDTLSKTDIPSAKHKVFQEEVNQIIESLRNRGDEQNARYHFALLISPLSVILIWHMIQYQVVVSNILVLVLIGIALWYAHYRMNIVIRQTKASIPNQSSISQNTQDFIQIKMTYILKATDIKKSRLLLVTLFYMLFSPILMFKLYVVGIGQVPFGTAMLGYGIAYVIAVVLWYFYFKRAFDVYDAIDDKLSFITSQL